MDNLEYEKFLLEIADNVERLVSIPKNRRRFEEHTCDLGKKQTTYLEARQRADIKYAEQKRIALTKPKLSDQISYLKTKGWVEADLSPLNMGVYSESHLKPPSEEMPPDPLLGFIPTSNGEPPPLRIDEALQNYYFLLATIHDRMREEYIPINSDIWAKRLAKTVWPVVENLYVNKQFIIKTALEHVIADLAGKQGKKRQRPMLLTCNAVESYAVPHWAKVQAKGRKIRVLTRPFKCGLGKATDRVTTENEEVFAFNQVLRQDQLELINRAVGSEELGKIKAFLIQKCNVPDPTNLTWREILAHLEVYLRSQKAKQPAATKQNTTPAKRRGIIGWIVEGIIALALLGICLYFFGVVTGILVFAALLTIFHLLVWLGLIKAFIYNILVSK